eukprot:TRINITY_DN113408_c0_g1_i1.p1 TRINITY_DN113408_c0_g1~~TRINITY_DN113408_c0_g1_i1.p1  ORF type:complete len:356 (+),score=34.96 TRINITY_DN113408_c0_g1_i1:85-1068(+)
MSFLCTRRNKAAAEDDGSSVPVSLSMFHPDASAGGRRETLRGTRKVAYAEAGATDGTTILWFVNMGISRWMALIHHDLAEQLGVRLVVIDRPGIGSTDQAPSNEDMVGATCADALTVLDELKVPKARVLASCAGTCYALAFLAAHPDRVDEGPIAIAPPWVSPHDCPTSSFGMRVASSLPSMVVRGFVSTVFPLVPMEKAAKSLESEFTPEEHAIVSDYHMCNLIPAMSAVMAESLQGSSGGGGIGVDAATCLSHVPARHIELDREAKVFAGDCDQLVPLESAEWFAKQLPKGSLEVMHGASHMGVSLIPEQMKQVLQYMLGQQALP